MQTGISTAYKPIVNRVVLNNAITLIVMENQATEVIASRIFLKESGSRQDSLEKAGLSHLLASVITKGTENFSSVEIAEQIESVGASLGTDVTTDYFLLSLKTVTADFPSMLKLAAEILRSPSFPEKEIAREKYLTIQNIRSQQEQPFNVAFQELRELMYGNHPYGFSLLGKEATVEKLTDSDLQTYHQTYFRPDNLVISIAGKINLETAINLVEQVFADWSIPAQTLPNLFLPQLNSQPQQSLKAQETQQSIIMLGYLAAQVKHEDYATLKLLSTYLGNGLSSRLFVELREKRGLAYDVSAFYPTRLHDSQFVVYMGTAPDNTETAYLGLLTEVERLREIELSQEELQAAKNKLLGQYALGKQTSAEIAQIYGWYEAINLGIDFDSQFLADIEAVTSENAKEIALRYFTQPYVSIVGPEQAINLV